MNRRTRPGRSVGPSLAGLLATLLAMTLLPMVGRAAPPENPDPAGSATPAEFAAPTESATPAALDSLVALALRENPRLLSLEASYAAARERVSPAGALPDPMFAYTFEGAPLRDPNPVEALQERYGVTQMFPFPGKRSLMKATMAQGAEMARWDIERSRLEVAGELENAYFDLYLLYASIAVREENSAALRDLAEISRTRYEVGIGAGQDLVKAHLELAQEANAVRVLRARIPAAMARVNAVLNRPPDTALGVPQLPADDAEEGEHATEGAANDSLGTGSLELAALEARALRMHPMLRMKEREIARDESGLRLARKEGWPDLTLSVEYMSMRDMPDAWMGMLGVSLPVWRWNKVAPKRREAEQTLLASRKGLEGARNEVLQGVRESWTALTTSRSQRDLLRDSLLPLAEQAFASARAAYETGRVDFLNLLESQRELLGLRLEYQEAVVGYHKSRVALAQAVGDLSLLGVNHESEP